jgi:hypothetical protein
MRARQARLSQELVEAIRPLFAARGRPFAMRAGGLCRQRRLGSSCAPRASMACRLGRYGGFEQPGKEAE